MVGLLKKHRPAYCLSFWEPARVRGRARVVGLLKKHRPARGRVRGRVSVRVRVSSLT